MPRIEKSAFDGAVFRVTSTTQPGEEVKLRVFEVDHEQFLAYLRDTYAAHAEKWTAFHPTIPVSEEQWIKYAFTALRARIARVNNERYEIRTDDDWQVPAQIAHVINAIGEVHVDVPVYTVKPVWNMEFDSYLLTRAEWVQVTRNLRVMGADIVKCKFIFVRSLAKDRNGDPEIMDLVPVRDQLGRIKRIHGNVPVDAQAAFVYLLFGFFPDIYSHLDAETTHARAIPGKYSIEAAAVMLERFEIAARSA